MSEIRELIGDWKACAWGTNYRSREAVRYLLRELWLTMLATLLAARKTLWGVLNGKDL